MKIIDALKYNYLEPGTSIFSMRTLTFLIITVTPIAFFCYALAKGNETAQIFAIATMSMIALLCSAIAVTKKA